MGEGKTKIDRGWEYEGLKGKKEAKDICVAWA